MTKHHLHKTHQSEFGRLCAGDGKNLLMTRRDFLQTGVVLLSGALLPRFLADLGAEGLSQEFSSKRIYIAPDDHTDYFWSAGEDVYRQAFQEMIDFYLDLVDATEENPSEQQSRWNCDGSYWLWTYEKNKSPHEYQRLISRIRDGHISFPLNALVVCLGGAPAEAVLRGMYYAGKVERRENLRFRLAISMENHTLPLGLASLWRGSGARFSWKGICGCDNQIPDPGDREYDIYWWKGLDGSRILMKWNSNLPSLSKGTPGQKMGGYAEARFPAAIVDYVDSDPGFISRYPYNVIGCFGYGWDNLKTLTDEFVTTSQELTNDERKIIVSNQEDFFVDFENNYGSSIQSVSTSFGNQWELYCAALAETSANIKRSVEKLRVAESISTLVSLVNPSFMNNRTDARDLAWMDLGLYWEHNFGMVNPQSGLTNERIAWQKRLDNEIQSFVDNLESDATVSLGSMIKRIGENESFFVYNPLGWKRTDYADYPLQGINPVHVIDISTGQEIPSQIVTLDGKNYIRILALNVPSIGYKVFEIRPGVGQEFSDAANITGNEIENQFYQIEVSESGALKSWIDKDQGGRQFAKIVNGRYINDLGAGAGTLRVENIGPVSATLLATSDQPLKHATRITLIRDSKRVEIQNNIIENFDDIFTWGFGFNLVNPDVWHEEVGAVIRAKLTTQGGHYSSRIKNSRYDWLTLNHFVDMNDGRVGIILSNADCFFMRLGNSTVSDLDVTTPQISVLAGGRVVNGNNGLPSQGGDKHFLQRFALRSHTGYDPVASMVFALEHQNPFTTGKVTGGDVYPEINYSYLYLDNQNVLLWALKPADDGLKSGIVVRVWNVSNEKSEFSISIDGGIAEALSLSHIETPIGNCTVKDGVLVDEINGQQIKTYALFPVQMPDTSGQRTSTPTAVVGQPTATIKPETVTPVPNATEAPSSATSTPGVGPEQGGEGKGCLYWLLNLLGIAPD